MAARSLRFSLVGAIAGSLALHVLGMGLLLRMSPRGPDRRPAVPPGSPAARVVLFDAVSAPAPREAPARSRTSSVPRRDPVQVAKARGPEVSARAFTPPVPEPPREVPAPSGAPTPAAPLTSNEAPAAAEPESGPSAAPSSGSGGIAGAASSPGVSAGSPSAGSDGASARLLEALHQRLQAAVARCYPEAAVRLRARGRVVVSFCLDAEGQATSVARTASSGSALLDRAATDCVVPGALPAPGAAGCYSVPVVFGGP